MKSLQDRTAEIQATLAELKRVRASLHRNAERR
jgi:hypothetical protein